MGDHICPWWMGYVLANPLRRFLEKPEKLLGPFVEPGMTAVDYGCGMGFFTIPMARMVGPEGEVLAVDLQEKMLQSLQRRADRAGLTERVVPMLPAGIEEISRNTVDLVAALYVVHELTDARAFFVEMQEILKPEGRILMVEPRMHVNETTFRQSVDVALSTGLSLQQEQSIPCRGWSAVLQSP